MQVKSFSCEIGGKTMTAEFTDLAEQAHGSVILRYGETAVLATAVMSEKERLDIDYFPLTVDYEERFYATGKILGSRFMRREGRPSEDAVLSGRVVDRTIRPLFPSHIRNEIQVIITVLALGDEDPDTIAVNAASLALATSDIPWGGPVSAVRIGRHCADGDNCYIVNPTYKERAAPETRLDILACGRDNTINMIEVGANEASEEEMAKGFALAAAEHKILQEFQENIVREIGKPKRAAPAPELPEVLTSLFAKEVAPKLPATVFSGEAGKHLIYALKKEW